MSEPLIERAREIAAFLGKPEAECIQRLQLGFGYQHQKVNDDFRRVNPKTDDELLAWYRTTEEYIWELSAYHCDQGFNYWGMCFGIAERLKAAGSRSVLCLGDGIGDLTLGLRLAGFHSVYHDLHESRTAEYARFRNLTHAKAFQSLMTAGWDPVDADSEFDAVVSLDYLEHVTDVPAWVRAVHLALKPGGLFMAQNAFDCGSGPDGAIPCHLSVNDKFAHAAPHTEGMALWDYLLTKEIGFVQESSNWYRKA